MGTKRGVAKFLSKLILPPLIRNTVTKFDRSSSYSLGDQGAHTNKNVYIVSHIDADTENLYFLRSKNRGFFSITFMKL